jgi:hypothetical protein
MTVYDLCNAYIDGSDEVEIWSIDKEETVFKGTHDEALYTEYAGEEVGSYGIENGIIVINIY